jgi:hypothetical protein
MTDSDPSTTSIETVVVDPDDVIEALEFNGQPPEYTNQRSAALRLSPPFTARMHATLHYSESGHYYPPEMDPKPLHLSPGLFVADSGISQPVRGEERSRAREELDDPTDEEVEAFVTEAFDVWRDDVRQRFVDEIDLHEHTPAAPHRVAVAYTEGDDE